MDAETIRRLNAINRVFYQTTAEDFDQTRGAAWPGWERLLPHLRIPLTVLDAGCGNGRFGVFLHQRLVGESTPAEPVITYHGIDSSPALLERARLSLDGRAGLVYRLEQRDLIEQPPDAGEYDLIALLGVLHHVPGHETRAALLRGLATRLRPGGLLVFTAWRFYEYERFRQRIVPWPEDLQQVEPGDYLLDWRRGAVSLRYCHYTDDTEHEALIRATGLREIETYRADGESGSANRYSILKN